MDFSFILFQALMVTGAIVLGNRLIVGRPVDPGHVASGLGLLPGIFPSHTDCFCAPILCG